MAHRLRDEAKEVFLSLDFQGLKTKLTLNETG